MITKIKVYPYGQLLPMHRPPGDVYISVTEPGMHNDIAPRNIFTKELAQEIIAFLRDNAATSEEKTLHVNCMVGKSRSGAIATFAAWYLGLNLEEFKNENIQIVPNLHILTTLINNVGV